MNKIKHLSIDKFYTLRALVYNKDNISVYVQGLFLKKHIRNVKDKRILEIGCGTGTLAICLSKEGAIVTAFDSNSDMLNVAKEESIKNNVKIKFRTGNALDFNYSTKFDIIIASSVMFHVKDLRKVVKCISNCSKVGTKVLIANPYNALYPSITKIPGKKYRTKLTTGYSTDTYYHPLSEYKNLFSENGFKLINSKNELLKRIHLKAKSSFSLVSKKYVGKPIANLLIFQKEITM